MAEWAAKRFWKAARAVPEAEGFAVHLDARPVRTPARRPLILPTVALAEGIADEWLAQAEAIDPLSMPLTRCANAAIDKVAPQRAAVEVMIADYAATDLLCYRAEASQTLAARQAEHWDPLLAWAADHFGAGLVVTVGVMPVDQPPTALARLRAAMVAMSDFDITGFHELVSLSGSYVLALSVTTGQLSPEAAWALSRLDEDWQAEQWGQDNSAAELAAIKRAAFVQARRFLCLANNPG